MSRTSQKPLTVISLDSGSFFQKTGLEQSAADMTLFVWEDIASRNA